MQLIRGCAGLALALLLVGSSLLFAQSGAGHRIGEPRARDIGIPFDGTPGPLNAISDVAGVKVGYKTLISGEGKLVVGKGPVRTGVTAILPRGKSGKAGVFAGFFSGNGNARRAAVPRGWR
jgi:D-aminopeptidase